MIENNLYNAVKNRFFTEFNASIQRHPRYRDSVKAYGKFSLGHERPQVGVRLESASGTRINLSPDDNIGDLISYVTMARVGNHPGTSIEWVWEDVFNVTAPISDLDVSSFIDGTRTKIQLPHVNITKRAQEPDLATDPRAVILKINGVQISARKIFAKTGLLELSERIPMGAQVTASYFYRDLDSPGHYYLEMTTETEFIVTPMLLEEDELLIEGTSGIEVEVSTKHSPVLIDLVLNLYLQKNSITHKIYLDRGVDYSIDVDGKVTFLQPLPRGMKLYACYRWQGATRGPFILDKEYTYMSNVIKGVTLAFGSRADAGDKHCIILTSTRERVANVKGGHYLLTMEWKVHARDPNTASELADHITADIWGNRKEHLRSEGVTIQELMATNESESSYDDATQAQYFENTINMEVMSEWKKFYPYVIKLRKYNSTVDIVTEEQRAELIRKVNPVLFEEIGKARDSVPVLYPQPPYPVFY